MHLLRRRTLASVALLVCPVVLILTTLIVLCGCDDQVHRTSVRPQIVQPTVQTQPMPVYGPPAPITPPTPPAPVTPSSTIRNGNTVINVPAGSTLELTHEQEGEDIGASSSFKRSANAEGASLLSSAPELAAGFDASAPEASLNGEEGGGASGGTTVASLELSGVRPSNPLFWIAGLIFIGGGVALYFKQVLAAAICGAVGVIMVAMAAFPAFALVLAIGGLGLVVLVYTGHIVVKAPAVDNTQAAMRDLLTLIEGQDRETRRTIKAKASTLPPATKTMIKRIKQRFDLPAERED